MLAVTIIEGKHMSRYLEILAYMKSVGNQIVAIGLENNWDILLALASIGFDRRKNLYLLDTMEFDTVINELRSTIRYNFSNLEVYNKKNKIYNKKHITPLSSVKNNLLLITIKY